jgi:hypothetical protein
VSLPGLPPLSPEAADLLNPDTLIHARCGHRFAEHPYGLAETICPFPARPPVEFEESPVTQSAPPARFYVSLSATCDEQHLGAILERMQAAQVSLATSDLALDGLSLSFSREDDNSYDVQRVPLDQPAPIVPDPPTPTSGPVVSAGPGAPPPDAVAPDPDAGAHTAPEEQQA